nr:putative polyamine transporter [Quercus suber]
MNVALREALVTAELSTAYPGNGGFVIWAERAFGPFWGSLMGTWKFLSSVINIAAFPVLCIDYMKQIIPAIESGVPRYLALLCSTLGLSFLNYTGLTIVGYTSVVLAVVSLLPFIFMCLIALPKIKPHSTFAGEVDQPQKTLPRALFITVIFTCMAYVFPLLAVIGALSVEPSEWGAGFMAQAAELIAGKWLKIFLEVGAMLAAIGPFEAQLSSTAFQLLGMADIGSLPKFFGLRSKWFNTPWVGILLSTSISLGVSYMNFTDIISSANFLYSLSMLLEFASFVWLRRKFPRLKRPYRVPIRLPLLVVMCLIPCGFLVVIMAIATKKVYLVSGIMTVAGIGWYYLMKICKSRKWFQFNTGGEVVVEENDHERVAGHL